MRPGFCTVLIRLLPIPVVKSRAENASTEYLKIYCPGKLNRTDILKALLLRDKKVYKFNY